MILRIVKVVVPFILLAAGVYGAWKMIGSRPQIEKREVKTIVPLVRTLEVERENLRLSVKSQGTVTARTVSDLVPEISGKVTYVSSSLAAGGFFEKGDVLLKIDPYDYQLAKIRTEAEVAQARLRLEQEQAEAEVAAREWAELGNGGEASPLVLRKPQVAQAEAALQAAGAALEQAERDLERTEFLAPFAGRVQQQSVDIGQYISRGVSVAKLYSVDVAEVRLPLPDADLAYVNIPLSYRGDRGKLNGPEVLLRASFAGQQHTWKGRIVRTEGEIDAATRMLYAVAEVANPYGHGPDPRRPPLSVGMFVEAEILGQWVRDVVVLPRSAIRGTDTVYVIDSENRLRFRKVEIFKQEKERVIVRSGLDHGDVVCLSPLETVVDGMNVTTTSGEEAS